MSYKLNRHQKYYLKNKEKEKLRKHIYYLKNKETIKIRTSKYHKNHPEIYRKSTSNWKHNNKEYIRKYKLNRYHTIYKKDPYFIILKRARSRLYDALKAKGIRKNIHVKNLFGCDIPFLKTYLESTFKPGMNWNLGGKIHIDHIIPCDSFNIKNPVELKKCFHYTNLQVLWAIDNIKKSNKIVL